jgi:hypothetical protein
MGIAVGVLTQETVAAGAEELRSPGTKARTMRVAYWAMDAVGNGMCGVGWIASTPGGKRGMGWGRCGG